MLFNVVRVVHVAGEVVEHRQVLPRNFQLRFEFRRVRSVNWRRLLNVRFYILGLKQRLTTLSNYLGLKSQAIPAGQDDVALVLKVVVRIYVWHMDVRKSFVTNRKHRRVRFFDDWRRSSVALLVDLVCTPRFVTLAD